MTFNDKNPENVVFTRHILKIANLSLRIKLH